jgi:hypothetical protein
MKRALEMGSGVMAYKPSFRKAELSVQIWLRGIYTECGFHKPILEK